MDHVWSDVTVDEASLRVHVAAIRKALGDGQFGNRYIANVKGRGYSFVGTVVPLAGSTESGNDYVALSILGCLTAPFSGDFDTAREMVDRAVALNGAFVRDPIHPYHRWIVSKQIDLVIWRRSVSSLGLQHHTKEFSHERHCFRWSARILQASRWVGSPNCRVGRFLCRRVRQAGLRDELVSLAVRNGLSRRGA